MWLRKKSNGGTKAFLIDPKEGGYVGSLKHLGFIGVTEHGQYTVTLIGKRWMGVLNDNR